jgi:drug/metabolite transporter (DMT)-like permease
MQTELLLAVLAGLGGMLGWGLADLFAKKTIDEIGDVVSLVLAHIIGTAVIAAVLVVNLIGGGSFAIPSDAATWAGLAFFGVLQGLVYLLVYIGFGKGQVSILNPVFASFTGLVALISVLFLGEALSGQLAFALVIIFFGIMLLNSDPSAFMERRIRFLRVPGFREVALATVFAAIWTLGWNSFVGGKGWLSYAVLMYVFMTIALLAYAWMRRIPLKVGNPGMWKYLLLIGVCEVGAYVAISWGYSATGLTSVVALLSGAFSLPTIALARVVLKERASHLHVIAGIIIVIGIAFVAML